MASISTYNIITPGAQSSASNTDMNMVNGFLKITGAPSISFKNTVSAVVLDPINETREVITVSPTAASGAQTYSIRIQQFVKTLGRNVSKIFSYSAATGDSAATISAAFVAMINLDREIAVTAAAVSTTGFSLTPASLSSDINVILISTGSGLSQASTWVSSNGSAVTAATTYSWTSTTSNLTTYTRATGTQPATSNALANGTLFQITLAAGETGTIVMHDGSSYGAGQTFIARCNVSNNDTAASATISFGPTTDVNILTNTLGVTPTAVTLVATPGRGLGSELALRGIVGATAATTYTQVKVNWNDVSAQGGTPIAKEHNVFVDGTTSSGNLTAFRYVALNLLAGYTGTNNAVSSTVNTEGYAAF
jgi:hypothetical protein